MFGRRLSEYVRFEWPLLALMAVVGLARLCLSVSGLPDSAVRWVSLNAVLWTGTIWLGIAMAARRFGSRKAARAPAVA